MTLRTRQPTGSGKHGARSGAGGLSGVREMGERDGERESEVVREASQVCSTSPALAWP
jgi:hypothetical protein